MSIPKWLVEIAFWLGRTFGEYVVIVAKDKLQHYWRRQFASRNILILGAKQTGKTSLLIYLQQGKPYEVVDGEIRTPNPTALAAIVDKKFALDQGNWGRLKCDVPGDLDLRETWAQAIKDIQPHGIIYMVDGRLSDSKLETAVDDMFNDVLVHYTVGPRELAVIHVFVNFSDHWARSRLDEASKARFVAGVVESRQRPHRNLHEIQFDVASTQLAANKKTWPEVQRALKRFGADLAEG